MCPQRSTEILALAVTLGSTGNDFWRLFLQKCRSFYCQDEENSDYFELFGNFYDAEVLADVEDDEGGATCWRSSALSQVRQSLTRG